MSELHDLSAAQQLRALRAREVSSRELTEHYLQRIDRDGDALGAFVTVVPDLALDAADCADRAIARGELAALTGLPLGIKDLQATAGIQTTAGTAALVGMIPAEDSWTVGLLRAAGAVFVGKTNASELGSTCYTEDYVAANPAVTPYDRTRYSSGSSGGAATAVAAGLLPVAHGSDGAGSIRTPAAATNLVGMKPSRGLVSPAPATSFMNTTTEGPLARTVEDAAILLDVMAQAWPGDIYGWRSEESFADAARAARAPTLRIAVWSDTGLDRVEMHPDLVDATARTAMLLRDLGHDVQEIDIPARFDEQVLTALKTWFTYSVALAVLTAIPSERRSLLSPLTQHMVTEGSRFSGADVIMAQAVLARYASTFLTAFDRFDVALTPTTSAPPVPRGHFLSGGLESVLDRMLDWSAHTPWANMTGQPAVAAPAGLNAQGLPLGVQLVGRQRADAQLIGLAAPLESASGGQQTGPPDWSGEAES